MREETSDGADVAMPVQMAGVMVTGIAADGSQDKDRTRQHVRIYSTMHRTALLPPFTEGETEA